MATTTIFKRKYAGAGALAADPAYALTKAAGFNITTNYVAQGLTFDGRYLWVCTQGSAGRTPDIFQVCQVTEKVVKRNITTLGAAKMLWDIVYVEDGDYFYGLVSDDISGTNMRLWMISKDGIPIKQLVTGLATNCRGVSFNGLFIFVSWASGYANKIDTYDRNGNLMRAFSTFSPTAAMNGPGLAWNGRVLIVKSDDDLVAIHQFSERTLPFVTNPVRVVTKESDTAASKSPIAWDGQYVYHLDSS